MGRRLEDVDWLDFRAYVRHCPPSSALKRATNPDYWVTPELTFLRDMEYRLAWLMWAKSEDGARRRNHPKPVPLTEAERSAAKTEREKYSPMPIPDMLKFLGWDPRKAIN